MIRIRPWNPTHIEGMLLSMQEARGSHAKTPGSVTRLLGQMQAGPATEREAAAAAIVRRYFARLAEVVGRQLAPRLKRRVDPDDLVLTTFHSFCLRLANGQFKLDDREDFWQLLVRIALNKTRKEATAQTAQKRDPRRELGLTADDGTRIEVLDRRAPTPDEAAIMAEEMALLLDSLPADIRPMEVRGAHQRGDRDEAGLHDPYGGAQGAADSRGLESSRPR